MAVAPDTGFERTLAHAMEIWFEPEIRRRQELSGSTEPFPLQAAQAILFADGRPNVIRLNSEVQVQGMVELKAGVAKTPGDEVLYEDIQGMSVVLPETEDPNCGHFTVVAIGDRWYGSFDSRYNKGKAADLLSAAEEFLGAASDAISAGRARPAVDNLFSAAELAANAFIIASPFPGDPEVGGHGFVHSRFNLFARDGNVEPDHRRAFNSLSSWRTKARYVTGRLTVSDEQIARWYEDVEDMVRSVRERLS
jgi:hypothetical protein